MIVDYIMRVKNKIFKRHISLIFLVPLGLFKDLPFFNDIKIESNLNSNQIAEFYSRNGRLNITEEVVTEYQKKGYTFFGIRKETTLIGGMWIFNNVVSLKSLSFRTLQEKKRGKIKFDDDVLYACLLLIDPLYRGKKYGLCLWKYILEYYSSSSYKKIVAITGADNLAMIKTMYRLQARIIGIVELTNILGFCNRKEHSLDNNEKCWIQLN